MSELRLEWRGTVLTSNLTDAEASAICARIPPDHQSASYTQSLIRDLERYGSLFESKRYWLHMHASRQLQREEIQAEAEKNRARLEEEAKYGKEPSNFDATASFQLERVANFLAPGAFAIPTGAKVTFESGPYMVTIRSTAKDRTRWPGGFLVIGNTGFGSPNTPLARMDAQGYLFFADAGRSSPELAALLDAFNDDPATCVAKMGKATGRCVFCARELTEPISMTMGYGKICSIHYSLPWSAEAMACKKVQQDAA